MFYRIVMSPPGYDHPRNFSIAKYTTLEFESYCGNVMNTEGSRRFFANIEEAREAMPHDAIQLEFEAQFQFIELWEVLESGA